MQVFRVGGCVRDALLGEARKVDSTLKTDRDWVVVGSTPEAISPCNSATTSSRISANRFI